MLIAENLIEKINKAKDTFKRLGVIVTTRRNDVTAILSKHNITGSDPKNIGQTIKSIFSAIKGGNDAFTKDLAALIAETETKKSSAKKSNAQTSSFDGSSDLVIQISEDLKSAANLISEEDAALAGGEAGKKVARDQASNMLMHLSIFIALLIGIAIAITYLK
jgi:hypothetical protein